MNHDHHAFVYNGMTEVKAQWGKSRRPNFVVNHAGLAGIAVTAHLLYDPKDVFHVLSCFQHNP